ncbi:MaoC family dehydratase N-terminal domain-containing protein [Nocardia sp. NPDC059239]|uniref:FAS1-like dehydratase domain-containing protein n=1 Tax=Nocardia sp. NPDC059239 TaxID=3346785 RepID=UPI00368391DD
MGQQENGGVHMIPPFNELRALIGKSATYTAPEEIGCASARYYAQATADNNPLYRDVASAKEVGLPSTIVPPTWLFDTNQYADLPRNADGYAGHWPIELPGMRSVRGGHDYQWFRDIYPHDIITAHWRITDVTERTARSGTSMIVVTSSCHYTDERGAPIAQQTETLLFMDMIS